MLNLWELMTHAEASHPIKSKRAEISEMLRELSARSTAGQELSIGSTERGWIIKIHSCYSDYEATILIPTDGRLPIEVVTDQRIVAVEMGQDS